MQQCHFFSACGLNQGTSYNVKEIFAGRLSRLRDNLQKPQNFSSANNLYYIVQYLAKVQHHHSNVNSFLMCTFTSKVVFNFVKLRNFSLILLLTTVVINDTYVCIHMYSSGQKKVPVSIACNAVSFLFRWRFVYVFLCVSLLKPCFIKLMKVK